MNGNHILDHQKFVLQLKICSARKLTSPCNAFIQIELGDWTRQTPIKKHTERPLWNQLFIFPVNSQSSFTIYLKQRDVLGKVSLIGKAVVPIPEKPSELQDIWVVLEGLNTDVHLCMELEPLGERSLDSVLMKQNSSRGSLIRFSSLRLLGSSNDKLSTHVTSESASSSEPFHTNTSSSSFALRAGAVTLNEICQALDRIRSIIYVTGSEHMDPDPKARHKVLQTVKEELEEITLQIDKIDGLSEEWKEKLTELTSDYSKDCLTMLTDEAWANVTLKHHSTRLPPPLPSKEKMARERLSRKLSSDVQTSPSTPPLPGAPPPKPPPFPPPPVLDDLATKSSESSFEKKPLEHEVITKSHFLSSLEAFDELLDSGFVVEFPNGTKKQLKFPKLGDIVNCRLDCFLFDGACSEAISYDLSSQIRTFSVIEGSHPDIPKGLVSAFLKIPDGQELAVVTVTPEWGFGDDGHVKGVPPSSTLIFEIRNVSYAKGEAIFEPELIISHTDLSFSREALEKTSNRTPVNKTPNELNTPTSGMTLNETPPIQRRRSLLRSFSSKEKESSEKGAKPTEEITKESKKKLDSPIKTPQRPARPQQSLIANKASPSINNISKLSLPPSNLNLSPIVRSDSEKLMIAELGRRLSTRGIPKDEADV